MQQEQVFVVPREVLFGKRRQQGFFLGNKNQLFRKIDNTGFFAPRAKMEENPDYKQIIPYLILRYHDKVFIYQRLKASTEQRLVDLYSIGLGGHVNPCRSKDLNSLLVNNMHRELWEEVEIKTPYSYRFLGVVNDDFTQVGRHHFGLVYLFSLSSEEIAIREKEKLAGKLVSALTLRDESIALESWSAIILDQLLESLYIN